METLRRRSKPENKGFGVVFIYGVNTQIVARQISVENQGLLVKSKFLVIKCSKYVHLQNS
jgi:hypothetical protein